MTGERGKGDEDDDIKNYSLSSSLYVFFMQQLRLERKNQFKERINLHHHHT